MSTALASWSALALCFAGMVALSLAMDRHHRQLTGEPAPTRWRRTGLRGAGVLLLALSAWPCIAAWGWTVGSVAWCGWLSAGAWLVAGALPYAPRLVATAAAGAGGLGLVLLLAG